MSLYREGPDPVTLLTAFLLMCLLVAIAVAFLAYAIDARTLDRNGMVTSEAPAHASVEAVLPKGDKLK